MSMPVMLSSGVVHLDPLVCGLTSESGDTTLSRSPQTAVWRSAYCGCMWAMLWGADTAAA